MCASELPCPTLWTNSMDASLTDISTRSCRCYSRSATTCRRCCNYCVHISVRV